MKRPKISSNEEFSARLEEKKSLWRRRADAGLPHVRRFVKDLIRRRLIAFRRSGGNPDRGAGSAWVSSDPADIQVILFSRKLSENSRSLRAAVAAAFDATTGKGRSVEVIYSRRADESANNYEVGVLRAQKSTTIRCIHLEAVNAVLCPRMTDS